VSDTEPASKGDLDQERVVLSYEGIQFKTRILCQVAAWVLRHANWMTQIWARTVMRVLLWFCGGRRFRVFGQEHLDSFAPDTSAILVSNHRSFFDFFVVTWATVTRSRLTRRILFPVRAAFFYETWVGGLINAFLTGMSMFPPFLREKSGKKFNQLALDLISRELMESPTAVGLHPEGKRGKGDPFVLLPAQPGVGKMVLEAHKARIVPVFIVGLSNNLAREMWWNWTSPNAHPIHICFGSDIDLSDLRDEGVRASTQLRASRRCLDAILEVGLKQKERHEAAGLSLADRPAVVNA